MARGWRRRALRAAPLAALAALAALWALAPAPAPAPDAPRQLLPGREPAALAHFLADFSNYLHVYPDIESWTIEDEWSNYTSWRYEVSYECGARCGGRVTLRHDAGGAAGAGGAGSGEHRVSARDVRCTRLPLLPWLDLCEETETETLITGSEEGAVVQQATRGRCGPLAALLARCRPPPAPARARTQLHFQ